MNSHQAAYDDCEFCNEFAGGSTNSFAVHYSGELANRTILESDGFRVLPSLGQIVPGYLLLVPNRHYRAFGDMPREELKAVETLKTKLSDGLRSKYGTFLFFEHGARTSGSGGCGISHAHLHIVPFPAERDPVAELLRTFPFEEIAGLPGLKGVQPDRAYLYYESVRGSKYVFYPPFIPSQYIRRLLADALGTPEWDWRRCGKEERFFGTLSQVSELLAGAPR